MASGHRSRVATLRVGRTPRPPSIPPSPPTRTSGRSSGECAEWRCPIASGPVRARSPRRPSATVDPWTLCDALGPSPGHSGVFRASNLATSLVLGCERVGSAAENRGTRIRASGLIRRGSALRGIRLQWPVYEPLQPHPRLPMHHEHGMVPVRCGMQGASVKRAGETGEGGGCAEGGGPTLALICELLRRWVVGGALWRPGCVGPSPLGTSVRVSIIITTKVPARFPPSDGAGKTALQSDKPI